MSIFASGMSIIAALLEQWLTGIETPQPLSIRFISWNFAICPFAMVLSLASDLAKWVNTPSTIICGIFAICAISSAASWLTWNPRRLKPVSILIWAVMPRPARFAYSSSSLACLREYTVGRTPLPAKAPNCSGNTAPKTKIGLFSPCLRKVSASSTVAVA